MSTKRVCVLLAEGFEEIEAIALIDVLRRAQVEVVTLGVTGTRVRGAHGITVEADRNLASGAGEAWDIVILPGGMPGATNLRDHTGVQSLLRAQHDGGGTVAAICAAPIALGKAGLLDGVRATCYPGFEDQLTGAGATISDERVVHDGRVITSRGPGTAIELALHLVGTLVSAKTAAELRRGMLV